MGGLKTSASVLPVPVFSIFLILGMAFFQSALSQENQDEGPVTVVTKDNTQYSNVRYQIRDNGLFLFNSEGMTVVPYDQLPDDLSEFPKDVQDAIRAKQTPPPPAPVDGSVISFTTKSGLTMENVSYMLSQTGIVVHTHSSGDVTLSYDQIDLSSVPADVQIRIAKIRQTTSDAHPADNASSALPGKITVITDVIPTSIKTTVPIDSHMDVEGVTVKAGAVLTPIGIKDNSYIVPVQIRITRHLADPLHTGTQVESMHAVPGINTDDLQDNSHMANTTQEVNGTGLIPIDQTKVKTETSTPEVAQNSHEPTSTTGNPAASVPNPDFEKPADVFKPFTQVVDSLKAAGFVFDSESTDPDAPESVKVKGYAGKTHDSKQWVAIVFHIDDEVVRVYIGQILGGDNVTIDAIRPLPSDVQHTVDILNSALATPLSKPDTDTVSTFYRNYCPANKVRVLLACGDQGLVEVIAAANGDDKAMWGLQMSSFKGAYKVPTVHTDDGTFLTSLFIDQGATSWFLTADGGDTNLLHSVRSMHYYSTSDQQMANAIGESLPSQSMETSVDKIVLDQSGLKNFCDGAQKWLDSNKANAAPLSNTDLNDNYHLQAVGNAASGGYVGYELMYSKDDQSATFERSQSPEVKFLLWMCSQPTFTSNQQGVSAIYSEWQAFLDYKSNSAGQ